jgi:hypothetical protein
LPEHHKNEKTPIKTPHLSIFPLRMEDFNRMLAAQAEAVRQLEQELTTMIFDEDTDYSSGERYEVTPEFYDRISNRSWDMVPVDRSFDPEKTNRYLSLLQPQDRQFVGKLLTNTKYIRFSDFKKSLEAAFELFRSSFINKPFYLMMPTNKIGSEHWITALLWSKIREMNLVDIVSLDYDFPLSSDQKYDILILDDAIYSGHHLIGTIDEMTYALAEKTGKSQAEVGSHFQFHLVVPYTNPDGVSGIRSFGKDLNINIALYPNQEILGLNRYFDPSAYFVDEREFSEKFGSDSYTYPAVYFDYKVAGYGSSFPGIYLEGRVPGGTPVGSILKANPSRYRIEELKELLVSGLPETPAVSGSETLLDTLPQKLSKAIKAALPIPVIEKYLSFIDYEGDPWRDVTLSTYDLRENEAELKRRFPDFQIDWQQVLTYLEEQPGDPDSVYQDTR